MCLGVMAMADEFKFKNILPKEHYISKYIEMSTSLTDAYPEYHFLGALNHLSVLADRRFIIEVTPQNLFTNIWACLLGKSTVSRKSTAIDINISLLEAAELSEKLLPDDATPEAFLDELQEKPQATFNNGEFGEWLAKARKKYQEGITALMSKLYDNPPRHKRKLRRETICVEKPYVSMLVALVPSQMTRYADIDDLESGFFPRFLFVYPERYKKRMDTRKANEEDTKKKMELANWLRDAHKAIDKIKQKKEYVVLVPSEEALATFNEWCRKYEDYIQKSRDGDDIASFFGRASIYVLKIAALLELGAVHNFSNFSNFNNISYFSKISGNQEVEAEIINKPTNSTNLLISTEAVKTAIYYAQNLFLPNAKKIVGLVQAHSNNTQIERVLKLALKHAKDGKIGHSYLLSRANMKAKDFNQCIFTLVESERLAIEDIAVKKRVYIILPEVELNKANLPDIEHFADKNEKEEIRL